MENKEYKVGFVAMEAIEGVNIERFTKRHILVNADAYPANIWSWNSLEICA